MKITKGKLNMSDPITLRVPDGQSIVPNLYSEEAIARGRETDSRMQQKALLWIDLVKFLEAKGIDIDEVKSDDYPHLFFMLDIGGTLVKIYVDKILSSKQSKNGEKDV